MPLPLTQELYWDWLDSATDESASPDCQSLDAASDVWSKSSCGPSHVGMCLMWSSGSNPQLQLEGSSFWPSLLSLGIDDQAITWSAHYQRMSSSSSELSISPAGALIWVTISNNFSTRNLCYTILHLFLISCVEDIQSSSFRSVVGRACFP